MAVSITLNPITGEFDLVGGGAASGVDSVNTRTGAVVLSKSDVGLTNVDNTSDATKNSASVTLTNKTIDAANNTISNISNSEIKSAAAIDASKIADGSVSSTEFQYLSNVTSDIQTQINSKFTTPSGTISQYVRGNGTLATFPTVPANLDDLSDVVISGPSNGQVLTYDLGTSSWKNATPSGGGGTGSAGDIAETSFSMANNQSSAANVTGLVFANATVRSFKALISIEVDATSDLFQAVELLGIQKGASWEMLQTSTGDNAQVIFSITSAGQIQYISGNISGFVSGKIKFKASTTTIG